MKRKIFLILLLLIINSFVFSQSGLVEELANSLQKTNASLKEMTQINSELTSEKEQLEQQIENLSNALENSNDIIIELQNRIIEDQKEIDELRSIVRKDVYAEEDFKNFGVFIAYSQEKEKYDATVGVHYFLENSPVYFSFFSNIFHPSLNLGVGLRL